MLGVEFGEKVSYKVPKGAKLEKLSPIWKHGIFVGVKRKSWEVMVARPEGVVFARSARRVRVDKRWSEDCVNWVKWAPWHRYKDPEDLDGEVPEGVSAGDVPEGSGPVKVVVDIRQPIPKDFFISKNDAEKHGYTRGCAGCSSWFRGLSRQPHSEACRAMFAR